MGDQLSLFASEDTTKKATKSSPKTNSAIEKIYYSIGEVAELLQVSPSLIRFWEGEFRELKPKKNARGVRKFKKKDIELLQLIYHLVKEKGYTLSGAKEAIKNDKENLQSKAEAIETLKDIRSFLVDLKAKL